ncbi:hypothetical protein PQR14_35365 [Paraburkholderia bryophila]|uniref:hypothetical protein n=1 Tax=Paraburkholderia bryophila TaxID=420952 RepID=UPI0038BA406D
MCAICDFKIEFDVSHPQALTVAVATREAIEAGTLPERIFEGPLGNAKLRVAAISAMKDLQDRLEAAIPPAELLALPDFYVLLIENGTWGFFHPTANGFDPDIVPDVPNLTAENRAERDRVLIASETAMQEVFSGRLAFSRALSDSLIVLDASPADSAHILSTLHKTLELKNCDFPLID